MGAGGEGFIGGEIRYVIFRKHDKSSGTVGRFM